MDADGRREPRESSRLKSLEHQNRIGMRKKSVFVFLLLSVRIKRQGIPVRIAIDGKRTVSDGSVIISELVEIRLLFHAGASPPSSVSSSPPGSVTPWSGSFPPRKIEQDEPAAATKASTAASNNAVILCFNEAFSFSFSEAPLYHTRRVSSTVFHIILIGIF